MSSIAATRHIEEQVLAAVNRATDATLTALLREQSDHVAAYVVGRLPVARANRLCAALPPDLARRALDAAAETSLDRSALAQLLSRLSSRDGPPSTPAAVRALDLAGRLLGSLTIETNND